MPEELLTQRPLSDAIRAAEALGGADLTGAVRAPVEQSDVQPRQVYSLRMPVERLEDLRRLADDRHETPSAMMRRWVLERLDRESLTAGLLRDLDLRGSYAQAADIFFDNEQNVAVLNLDVPGVDADNVNVSLEDDELLVDVNYPLVGEGLEVISRRRPVGRHVLRFPVAHQVLQDAIRTTVEHGLARIEVPAVPRRPAQTEVETASSANGRRERRGATATSSAPKRADLSAVRSWARQNDYAVTARGRIPAPVLAAYEAANNPVEAEPESVATGRVLKQGRGRRVSM